jgi:hypothetical protein
MEKHIRTFIEDDGVVTTWEYDPSKTKSGPCDVTIKYPKDFMDIEQKATINTHKTKQKYLNPNNGKYVSYQRYQQLIKEGKINK